MLSTIDKLIVNPSAFGGFGAGSPYEERKQYWSYDPKTRTFTKNEGRRHGGGAHKNNNETLR